jgi:hypothetical protein
MRRGLRSALLAGAVALAGAAVQAAGYGYGYDSRIDTCLKYAGLQGQYALRVVTAVDGKTYHVFDGFRATPKQIARINHCLGPNGTQVITMRRRDVQEIVRCNNVMVGGTGYCINHPDAMLLLRPAADHKY